MAACYPCHAHTHTRIKQYGSDELERGLISFGLDDYQVAAIMNNLIKDADGNDDGKINYREFVALSGLGQVRVCLLTFFFFWMMYVMRILYVCMWECVCE